MKNYLLSVDDGGTYIKAAVFDRRGRQLGSARQYNEVLRPVPGWTEYDQSSLWEINCNCIRKVIEETKIDPEEIACIGIAAQGCGFYAVDIKGENIRNAISSADARACDQVKRWIEDGTDKEAYKYIYRHSSTSHLNSILAWLKENEPENYKKIAHLFSMKDLLIFRFTGQTVSGYGCQSSSGLMDLNTGQFSRELAEMFGIPEMYDKFGPLRWDGEICGTVTEQAAKECGCAAGTPVAAGSHDVVACALAMGITDSEPCFMITGTHGINGYISDVPILNGTIRYNEYFAFPGKFLIEEGYPSSSATLEWVISVLFSDDHKNPEEIYEKVNCEVENVDPGKSNLIFLPFLRGHRDNAEAAGAWIGLRPEHTRGHMLRAVYEGVAFTHVMQMEHLFANRKRPSKIRMAGGATQSKTWVQIFADIFNIPFEIIPNQEMGVKGAAIVAAAAVGLYPNVQTAVENMTCSGDMIYPESERVKVYKEKFEDFKKAVTAEDSLCVSK